MTIQQLRCFVTAAKLLSIRRAADELYISQPAVTNHIHALEAELNVPLFYRSQRQITLTEPGRIFYMDAVDILDRLTLAAQRVRQPSVTGELLHVACESTIQLPHLPEIYREYHALMPEVYISNTEVGSGERFSLFSSGKLDVCFIAASSPLERAGISYLTLQKSRFCCVVSVNHRLAGREQITLNDLAHETLILLDTAHSPSENAQVQQMLQFSLPEAEYCFSGSSLYSIPMIEAGLGIAIMPEVVCPPLQSLERIPFVPEIPVETGVIWHSGETSKKITAFLDVVRKYFTKESK